MPIFVSHACGARDTSSSLLGRAALENRTFVNRFAFWLSARYSFSCCFCAFEPLKTLCRSLEYTKHALGAAFVSSKTSDHMQALSLSRNDCSDYALCRSCWIIEVSLNGVLSKPPCLESFVNVARNVLTHMLMYKHAYMTCATESQGNARTRALLRRAKTN